MQEFSVVIPARYASTRLPGKPLLMIAGKPMIQHVYERALTSSASDVCIATDDERIAEAAEKFGANYCMTRQDHESGTDRIQEVAAKMQWPDDRVIVNVQGDEPLIPAAVINQVAMLLADNSHAGMATLAEKITDMESVLNPNIVKVVMANNHNALYFSRAPIPWDRDGWQALTESNVQHTLQTDYYRHIGIYAYRASFLHQFVTWPMAQLEAIEKLEQLRAMENGVQIMVQEACEAIPAGVDTEADLALVKSLLEN